MDTITHGILGALIGKGYFSDRYGKVATFALTLGAVFPDSDVVAEIVTRDPLAIIKEHRALTHSFVAMPFFAFLLAILTLALIPWVRRRFGRWREIHSPPLGMLTLIYAIGITSHILLDDMTSFGTRMWYPISSTRVAWDWLFIVDFTFTAILLIPQVIAWVYSSGSDAARQREGAESRPRALRMWLIFTASTFVIWLLLRVAAYPFRLWVALVISAVLAVLFFAPGIGGWGFRVTRARWCQAGFGAIVVYIFGCALAHHAAMNRVKAFAEEKHVTVERIAALPIPPSLFDWGDAIRTPDGIYEAQFDLRDKNLPTFSWVPDSPPDPFIARARALPSVQLYWQFARFPLIRSFERGGEHIVDFGENRFSDGRRRSPQPFTWEVVFDNSGNVIDEGWLTNGMSQQRMRRMVPQQPVPRPAAKAKS
jgi:membrane-bound metal-dependent hydrolase YbcI (DUF457 family)